MTTGWWIAGTHPVTCAGDAAFVPYGQLANSAAWQVYPNIIPATFNIGNDLTSIMTKSNKFDMFTKLGGPYGSNSIEELTATSITGPWTVVGTWPAPYPQGVVTYNTGAHLEQASLDGQVLLSYNVNGSNVPATRPIHTRSFSTYLTSKQKRG